MLVQLLGVRLENYTNSAPRLRAPQLLFRDRRLSDLPGYVALAFIESQDKSSGSTTYCLHPEPLVTGEFAPGFSILFGFVFASPFCAVLEVQRDEVGLDHDQGSGFLRHLTDRRDELEADGRVKAERLAVGLDCNVEECSWLDTGPGVEALHGDALSMQGCKGWRGEVQVRKCCGNIDEVEG